MPPRTLSPNPAPARLERARALAAALALAALAASGCASRAQAPAPGPAERRDATLLDVTAPAAARAGEDLPAPPASRAEPGAAPVAPVSEQERPGKLLIYSAITGHVPLDEANPPEPGATPASSEAMRAAAIEAEISGELERQEQLSVEEDASRVAPAPPEAPAPEDPARLAAAAAPPLRDVPEALFAVERKTVAAGEWQNARPLEVERRALDADRDGRPEEVRYVDAASGRLLRVEQDRDFDGTLDTWLVYADASLEVRTLDEDGDGRSDAWERYAQGRLAQRTEDTNGDGVRDLFFRYQGDSLVERLEDSNGDGQIDRVTSYRDRKRQKTEEDRSLDGTMDTWTTWTVVDGKEVVSRVARDSRGAGRPDLTETYETVEGETRLVRREEDTNGDGKADVLSVYEKGRLVQRAVSDEALAPL
jgi:hypothetical protein